MNAIIFDNGGRTLDRFTVIVGRAVFNMSTNALMPDGVNIFAGELDEEESPEQFTHLGTQVECATLPEEVQRAIALRVAQVTNNPIGEDL
jgi:hypothetical protein